MHLSADTPVWRQGTAPCGNVLLVRQGILRLERVTTAGERRIVGMAGRGMLLGLEGWLGQTYADDLVSCTPVRLVALRCRDVDLRREGLICLLDTRSVQVNRQRLAQALAAA